MTASRTTSELIAELDALEAKATKGPWNVVMFGDGLCVFREFPYRHFSDRVAKEYRPHETDDPDAEHRKVVRWLGKSPERESNLKLIAALRNAYPQLRAELQAALEDAARYRDGLRWYADGHHYDLEDWEDCSGESPNWIFPPPDTTEECWMVDNGGIARSILDHGHSINPNHAEDENITTAPDEEKS